MIEPLTGISIPGDDTSLRHYRNRGASSRKVIILTQAYQNTFGQRKIAELCGLFLEKAGLRLIAVEGASGPLGAPMKGKTLEELIQAHVPVSAGVEIARLDHPELVVEGVDNMDLNHRSSQAMAEVNLGRPMAEDSIKKWKSGLWQSQARIYGERFTRFRRGSLDLYGDGLDLNDQVRLLSREAASRSIDLADYGAVSGYFRAIAEDKGIPLWRVKRERRKFVVRLLKGLLGWWSRAPRKGPLGKLGFKAKNEITLDLRKAIPVFVLWANESGVSEKELTAGLQNRDPAMLTECKHWVEDFVVRRALTLRSDGIWAQSVLYEELMRIALIIGVPYFDLRQLRRYVCVNRKAKSFRESILDEIDSCALAIARKIGPEADRLFDIEESLNILTRALRMQIVPAGIDRLSTVISRSETYMDALEVLAGRKVLSATERMRIAGLLTNADQFYTMSKRRGMEMAEGAIRLMDAHGEDRCLLVIGGFHGDTASMILDDSGVSWSVVMPGIDVEEERKRGGEI